MKVISACLLLALSGCVNLTPEESCQAICAELSSCGVSIDGSSVTAGASCQSDCLDRISVQGNACKGSAAYLADCFQTYTCDGIDLFCSEEAESFATDCR